MKTIALVSCLCSAFVGTALFWTRPAKAATRFPTTPERSQALAVLEPARDAEPASIALAAKNAAEKLGPDSLLGERLRQAAAGEFDTNRLQDVVRQTVDALRFAPRKEAEMPLGFPAFTPTGEVEVKQYPAYRMVRADSAASGAFWRLFGHIKSNDIAMTAPVEMAMTNTERGSLRETNMAFLYGDRALGTVGKADRLEVLDVPSATVASTSFRGRRTAERVDEAKARLDAWLAARQDRYVPVGDYRLMGYNSPFVAEGEQFFEVQISVRPAEK